jgi:catechol 2,3-dioxygenase-like lactoylglutathione lyase family enzyme
MAIRLDHTIVAARDQEASARFFVELFGRPEPKHFGPFTVVELDNGVSLDFLTSDEDYEIQHYAFLITDDEFDEIFGRIKERGLDYWADPGRSQPGEIYTHFGGRGVYFEDPGGHYLEIMTKPYPIDG